MTGLALGIGPCVARARAVGVVVCLTVGCLGIALPASAQEDFDVRLFKPTITFSATGVPDRDFKDIDGDYGWRGLSVRANIPLGPAYVHPQSSILGHQVLLTAGFGARSQTVSVIEHQPRLYDGVLAGSAILLSRNLNLYYVSLGATFAEDQDTIKHARARFFGVGLGTYRKSEKLWFVYGGAFTYVYDRGLALPLFGIIYRASPDWTVAGAVPFFWRVTESFDPSLKLHYLLAASGQRYRFDNSEGTFPLEDSTVYERMREARLGVELEYRPARDVALLAQVGLAFARKLQFANLGEDAFFSQTVRPAPYVRLGVRFGIGKSVLDELPTGEGALGY